MDSRSVCPHDACPRSAGIFGNILTSREEFCSLETGIPGRPVCKYDILHDLFVVFVSCVDDEFYF